MRLILVGPPGSGKGTQAKLLAAREHLTHISTGDILREGIRTDTPLGRLARPFMQSGQLVPDDLVNELVADRFRRDDRPDRFVLDGYPRTLAQANSFDQVLRQQFLSLTAVVLFAIDDEEIIRRLSGRWTCPLCSTTYNVINRPPQRPDICDKDGTPLMQREDDKECTVRERLRAYHRNTQGLIPYYRDQGLVREVTAAGDVEAIYANLVQVLKQAGARC